MSDLKQPPAERVPDDVTSRALSVPTTGAKPDPSGVGAAPTSFTPPPDGVPDPDRAASSPDTPNAVADAAPDAPSSLPGDAALPGVVRLPASPPSAVSLPSRQLAMWVHVSALLIGLLLFVTGGATGVFTWAGPLFFYLLKNNEDEFVTEHAKEALNFNLSLLIYVVVATLVSTVLVLVLVGFVFLAVLAVLLPLLFVFWLVVTVVAATKASNGELYRYPMTMRLVS